MVSTITQDLTALIESLRRSGESGRGEGQVTRPGEAIQMLRAVALVLVFLFHFAGFAMRQDQSEWSVALGQWLLSIGAMGTNCFLMVSGALGWLSYEKAPVRWTEFAQRRVKRLYPPFFFMVALYVVLSVLFPAQSKLPKEWGDSILYLLRNLVLIPGVFPEQPLIRVTWTLALIFSYYLAIPVMRSSLGWMGVTRGRMPVVLALLAAVWVIATGVVPGLPGRAVFLLAGSSLAALRWVWRSERWDSGPWVGLGMGALAIRVAWQQSWGASGALWGLLFEMAGLAALIWGSLVWRRRARETTEWLTVFGLMLGNMGYSFYLVHGLVVKFAFVVLMPVIGGWMPAWGMLPMTLAMAVVASTTLFRMVEQRGRWPWEAPIRVAAPVGPLVVKERAQAMAAGA